MRREQHARCSNMSGYIDHAFQDGVVRAGNRRFFRSPSRRRPSGVASGKCSNPRARHWAHEDTPIDETNPHPAQASPPTYVILGACIALVSLLGGRSIRRHSALRVAHGSRDVASEKEFNALQTELLLVGAIWTVKESFVLDLGVRGARIGDENAVEVRLGFTWSLPMWEPTENAAAGAREL